MRAASRHGYALSGIGFARRRRYGAARVPFHALRVLSDCGRFRDLAYCACEGWPAIRSSFTAAAAPRPERAASAPFWETATDSHRAGDELTAAYKSDPLVAEVAEVLRVRGFGPDLSQMEPTDQLDAPNRGLPKSRVRRFAKRKSASRPSSIVLVNPSLSSTSQIDRVGWRWLWTRCFGASQGQS